MWNMNDVKEIKYKRGFVFYIVFDDGKSGEDEIKMTLTERDG